MSYGKKKEDTGLNLLERVKDHSTMAPGTLYHIRKIIKQEGNIITDEVHDVILKEFKDGFFIEQDTDSEYAIGTGEFEIFVRRKI